MSKKAWLNPRRKKMVKSFVRSGKKGVQVVEPHLHEYPHADKDKLGKDRKRKEELDSKKEKDGKEKDGKEKNKLEPNKKKREKDIEDAKKELACQLGA